MSGGALILAAVLVAWPRPQRVSETFWAPYSEAAFEEARRTQQPALIDVYADWCLPCVEMDHVTFRHSDVMQALASVSVFRLDVTRDVPPEGERLLGRYQIYGAPTVLFFDRSGQERTELRLMGFATPQEFLERLTRLLSRGN